MAFVTLPRPSRPSTQAPRARDRAPEVHGYETYASKVTAPAVERPVRRPGLPAPAVGSVVVVSLVVCALALWFGGASAPLAIGDPGGFVRWTLPLVRDIHDLAAATTIGAFLMGGLLVTEGATSQRRARCASIGFISASIWAVAGFLGVVFGYADIAGLPIGSHGFWSGLLSSVWDLEQLRCLLLTALAALVVAVAAALRPRRDGQVWLLVLSLVALYPLGLIGHAAGSNDHETAVDSLLLHIGGVTIWVGGLIALGLIWRSLGKTAAVTVQRYSRVATWCYVFVGLFGVINALLRMGGLSGLNSRYGVLVLLKVLCFLALGAIALGQRSRVVRRLRERADDIPARSLFVRLAALELIVMATAIALGVALSRSPTPVEVVAQSADRAIALTGYPMPPQITMARVFGMWQTEWLFSAVAVCGIGVYLAWVIRLLRRGDRWPVLRTMSWVAGWLLFLYAIDGGIAVYGRVLFSAHMAQHMIIAMFVPIFLVRGGVVTLAMRALPNRRDNTLGPRELLLAIVHSRFVGFVGNPIVAAILDFGGIMVFYFSGWFNFALTTHTGHLLMIAHFLAAGYLFSWAMVGIDPGPPRWSPPLRLMVLFITVAFHAFFGVAMMTGTAVLGGGFFQQLAVPWVTNTLRDQQGAGTITWGAGEPSTAIMVLFLAWEWIRKDENEARRQARQADRDGDADLNAYNQYLESLRGTPKE